MTIEQSVFTQKFMKVHKTATCSDSVEQPSAVFFSFYAAETRSCLDGLHKMLCIQCFIYYDVSILIQRI